MLIIETLGDIAAMRESVDVECKLAQGRDGKGAIPKDMWETYSAFANTQGGDIFLGLKEKSGHRFVLEGIADTPKVLKEFWDTLNNPQKISTCIIRDRWVKVLEIEGKSLIHIHVPPANRKQKPVYIKGNPMIGTYRRFNIGDMQVSEEMVRRMMAEQVEESRDAEILGEVVFDKLGKQEQLILITAHIEKTVDHARMMSILDIHPRDLSALLASLVDKKLLYQDGSGRGTIYFTAQAMAEDTMLERIFEGMEMERSWSEGERSGPLENQLSTLAEPVATKKRAPSEEVRQAILNLCALRTLQLEELEKLLNRSGESLRKKYLQPLIKEHKLRLMYPTRLNHPQQAYITVGSVIDKEYK